tara:strand:- start:63 stop:347 length:285 start_codon:yes stop_codon:yes gene_type:complete
MAEKDIKLKLVLERYPPGDRWTPANDFIKNEDNVAASNIILESLTAGIEYIFQKTQEKNYVIKAAEGKVYVYHEQEIAEPEPEPPKRYNLYGEF